MIPYTPTYIDAFFFRLFSQYSVSFSHFFNLMKKQELMGTRTAPAASVHIQRFTSIPYQSKPRHKFRAVIQTLTLLLSLAQALPVPADSNGPPLWPEESRVNYPAEPPRTGDLPVNTHLYHRIPIDTSSRQLNMTSLYDAPISTAPPSDMFLRKYHPVSRKYFLNVPDSTPLPTNKCVSLMNFFVSPTISNLFFLVIQVLHEPIP